MGNLKKNLCHSRKLAEKVISKCGPSRHAIRRVESEALALMYWYPITKSTANTYFLEMQKQMSVNQKVKQIQIPGETLQGKRTTFKLPFLDNNTPRKIYRGGGYCSGMAVYDKFGNVFKTVYGGLPYSQFDAEWFEKETKKVRRKELLYEKNGWAKCSKKTGSYTGDKEQSLPKIAIYNSEELCLARGRKEKQNRIDNGIQKSIGKLPKLTCLQGGDSFQNSQKRQKRRKVEISTKLPSVCCKQKNRFSKRKFQMPTELTCRRIEKED